MKDQLGALVDQCPEASWGVPGREDDGWRVYGNFPKLGVPFFRGPQIRNLGLYRGAPILGNSH